jgi:Transposase DDE domain
MSQKRTIKPTFQPALADKKKFLAPLQTPEIQAIVRSCGVDEGVDKYFALNVLCVYMFAGILKGAFQSLRGIAELSGNTLACWFSGLKDWTRSGLSVVNKRIPYTFYKDVYEALSKQANSPFSMPQIERKFGQFKIFDATYLRLCLKLVPWGKKQNCRDKKGQMLISMRIDEGGYIPNKVLDSEPTHCESHFEQMIDWVKSGFTYLFDRGYRRVKTLLKIHSSGNFFITRWNKIVHITVAQEMLFCPERQGDLEIVRDQRVRLGEGNRKSAPLFRRITAIFYGGETPVTLYLLTNRFDLTAFEVADIYRFRWEIESFFKWLKSCLKINHFFTYSENGIYSQIYITLILNLLLAIYHHNHNLNCRFGINTQRALMNDLMNFAICFGMGHALVCQINSKNSMALPPGSQTAVSATYEIVDS